MLGHGKIQGESSNVFRLTPHPITKVEDLLDPLVLYLSRYSTLVSLLKVVGRGNLFKFLDIFCGQVIKVPDPSVVDSAISLKYTLLPEVALTLGDTVLERLLLEFPGKSIRIPPSNVVRSAIRDVDIYLQMVSGRGPRTVSILSTHYGVTKSEVWWLFRRVVGVLGGDVDEEALKPLVDDSTEEDLVNAT